MICGVGKKEMGVERTVLGGVAVSSKNQPYTSIEREKIYD